MLTIKKVFLEPLLMSYQLHRTSVSGAGEDARCKLCVVVGSLKHILSGCKTRLTQGNYMWRHYHI